MGHGGPLKGFVYKISPLDGFQLAHVFSYGVDIQLHWVCGCVFEQGYFLVALPGCLRLTTKLPTISSACISQKVADLMATCCLLGHC